MFSFELHMQASPNGTLPAESMRNRLSAKGGYYELQQEKPGRKGTADHFHCFTDTQKIHSHLFQGAARLLFSRCDYRGLRWDWGIQRHYCIRPRYF